MNTGIRYTFWIAAALITGAIFPLLGLMLGCLAAGMGLHACLSSRPPEQKQDFDTGLLIEHLRQERLGELSRRVEAARVERAGQRKIR